MLAGYVTRGVMAGVVAGVVFGLFVALVANPLVAYADERAHGDAAADHEHGGDEAVIGMGLTETVSVVSGGLWAVLLGGVVFGVGFYLLEPGIPGTGAVKSYLLGAAGFVTVSGGPWLALPPVPPGARQSLPVATRLWVYGGMVVAGATCCVLAGVVYRRLRDAYGPTVAAVGTVLPFGLLAIAALVAPANTVRVALDPGLRAGLIGTVVFGQALLWFVLAATHAQLHAVETDRTTAVGATLGAD